MSLLINTTYPLLSQSGDICTKNIELPGNLSPNARQAEIQLTPQVRKFFTRLRSCFNSPIVFIWTHKQTELSKTLKLSLFQEIRKCANKQEEWGAQTQL